MTTTAPAPKGGTAMKQTERIEAPMGGPGRGGPMGGGMVGQKAMTFGPSAKRLIRQHDLPMKVVGIDFVDRRADVDQLVIIYFSAPHRVDFRDLVRDLARGLRARIELRQVGARD